MHYTIKVHAFVEDGEVKFKPIGSPAGWREEQGNPAGGKFVYNKHHLNVRENERTDMLFVLAKDDTKLGLQFPSKPKDAMWVIKPTQGHECPRHGDTFDYSVVAPVEVEAKPENGPRNRLRANNPNMEQEDWAFSLNFVPRTGTDGDPTTYVCWDPVIQNQNGGRPLVRSSSISTTTVVIVGAVIAIGALFFLTR